MKRLAYLSEINNLKRKVKKLQEVNEFLFDENKRIDEQNQAYERMLTKLGCITCVLKK